jgi:predicted Zn-dependent protease with MMP-like domain
MPRRKIQSPAFSHQEFEELVRRAVDGLPRHYRQLMDNVAVVVEEAPSAEVLEEVGAESEDELLGLYTGQARGTESFFDAAGQLPATIAIYRAPILRLCRTADEVIQEVQDTVVHEIGHHFGLDDDEMPY